VFFAATQKMDVWKKWVARRKKEKSCEKFCDFSEKRFFSKSVKLSQLSSLF